MRSCAVSGAICSSSELADMIGRAASTRWIVRRTVVTSAGSSADVRTRKVGLVIGEADCAAATK